MISNWKCPYCIMSSTRHWNVERHILNRHDGAGQPINAITEPAHVPKQHTHINPSYILGSMNSHTCARNAAFSSTQRRGEQQPNEKFSDLLETWLLEPMRKIVEFNSLRSQLFRGNYQAAFRPLNFSGSRSPACYDSLNNMGDRSHTQQLFQPGGDFETVAYRGYVCERCLIAHPLAVYRRKGKESGILTATVETIHECNPKRLSEVRLMKDRSSLLRDLHCNKLPEAVMAAVNQWTENENYLTSIELPKGPLTYNINSIKLNGLPDDYWVNRAIRDTTTKLTDVELLDFLKKSYSDTCAHFKVSASGKNKYSFRRYFLMGISKFRLRK